MARIAAKRRELVGAPIAHGLRAATATAIQHAEAKRKNIRLRLQERFTDPAWQPLETVDRRLSMTMLQPGTSVVLRSSLRYVGADAPGAVQRFASTTLRGVSIVVLLGGATLAFWLMFQRERVRGRSMPLRASHDIDSHWLAQNVFSMSPELVGALHDRLIAWPEVAAVVARMIVESKLANRISAGVRGPASNLELWLLVDRETLTGYERELIDALFFSKKTTSTDAVREKYKSVGFDPTRILKAPLEQQSDALLGIRA